MDYPDTGQPADWVPVPGWAPPGWEPDEQYVRRNRTSEFRWPSTDYWYRSRSGARRRARLIESYGATVTIEESQPILWPRHSLSTPRSGGNQSAALTGEALYFALGQRLAYDIARRPDDYYEVRRVLDSYAGMVASSAEFGRVLEAAIEYIANHLVAHLVQSIEDRQNPDFDVRAWIARHAADLWSEAAAIGG
ncbi:hypothetical protein HZU40_23630 [Mycolicibacterium fluoranthenivorans]|uniref:Uncharacterized protein n=1 Tax=Mycolicibacterium fluoranthenivorans TaxID=258505 RepID=A0A7G8PA21_9MYCO|nr:hypothetical protein [Mycolicibacterium fluoranthenivorans]QNJ91187.1 hypothetical protein HZU40_23630 [Mycolicibacterium fluoranthenivorans]